MLLPRFMDFFTENCVGKGCQLCKAVRHSQTLLKLEEKNLEVKKNEA